MRQQQQQRLIAQQMGRQGNTSELQRQMEGTQTSNSDMNPNQPHMNLMHQNKGSVQLQNQQSAINLLTNQGQHSQSLPTSQMQSETAQLRQHLDVNQQQRYAQQRLQPSGTSMQSHNIGDQQKQIYQSQRGQAAVSAASSDSTPQTGHASYVNWQEEAHKKITSLKDMYFAEIQNMYQKVSYKLQQIVSLRQQENYNQLEKLHEVKKYLREIMVFLSVNKCDVTPAYRKKFPSIEKFVLSVINSQRPRRQDQGPPPVQSIQKVQLHENHLNPLIQSSNIQFPRMMEQKNISLQQHSVSSLSGASYAQVNMSGYLKPEPNVDAGQGSRLASLQQGVDGSLQQTNMNALSVRNGVNLVQSNISSLQSTNSVNQQHVQEQQAMQSQQLGHQLQQPHQQMLQNQQQMHQQSRHHQQAGLLSAHQVPELQKMEKANEENIRQGFGAKIGTFSQRHGTVVGQTSVHNQLKSGVSFPISSSPMLQTSSPQNFQNSSPEIDQQNMPLSVSKAGTPPRFANSSFNVPSQSTPLAPYPMQGGSEKLVSNDSPLTTAGNIRVQQPAKTYAATEVLAIETSGISAFPLLTELSNPEISHGNTSTAITKSIITEEPLDRLIKAIKSISNEALTASVNDIGFILSMIDRIAGSGPGNGSRAAVGEDLTAMTMCRLQAENLASQGKSSRSMLMKRCTSSLPSVVVQTNGSSDYSFTQLVDLELSESEFTATSREKRPRTEVYYSLLREISYINQRLIDTMVDISEGDVNAFSAAEVESEGSQGVIVKCSYIAVALSPGLKSQYAKTPQLSPIQPLRLLVPWNYPNCSPVLLDKLPVTTSNENEDLSMKAKSKLIRLLCALSQPTSLNEIAKTWDFCTRTVISEYAEARGGGSFSSRYGSWESVL